MKAVNLGLAVVVGIMGALPSSSAAASEESTIAHVMLKHLRFIEGDVEPASSSPTCTALNSRIAPKRKSVKSSDDWKSVQQTAQFGSLTQSEQHFKQAGCNKLMANPSPTCKTLRARLEQDAETLSKSPAWDSFVRSNDWRDLREDYSKAEASECFAPPDPAKPDAAKNPNKASNG